MIKDKIGYIQDCVMLSKLAYESEKEEHGGWQEIFIPDIEFVYKESSENKSVLKQAKIFQKGKEIVISFKGTTLSTVDDLKSDLLITISKNPERFKKAVEFVEKIRHHFRRQSRTHFCCTQPTKFIVTGHSLGGAIAEWVSLRMGIEAYTFDSPGLPEIKNVLKTKNCYNFLISPNLINSYHAHFGCLYRIRAPKITSIEKEIKKVIAKNGKSIAEFVTNNSSMYFDPYTKTSIEKSLEMTFEYAFGENLIEHTLHTHKLDHIVTDLGHQGVDLELINPWTRKELLNIVGENDFPSSPSKYGEFLVRISRHIPDFEDKLQLVVKPLDPIVSETPRYCMIL